MGRPSSILEYLCSCGGDQVFEMVCVLNKDFDNLEKSLLLPLMLSTKQEIRLVGKIEKKESWNSWRMSRSYCFKIIKFHKCHVRTLCTPSRRSFLTSHRSVTVIHNDKICKYAWASIGPLKVYYLLKEQLGNYENIGCTQKDL